MPSRFVAPKRVETLEDVRKALQRVQEQCDAFGLRRARLELVTTSTTVKAGEYVRLSPRGGATLFVKLPKASASNIGQRIELSIERPSGTVKISAESPDTVSGLKTASFTLAGLVVLESNGTNQWSLTNQLPTNSPGAATNYFFSNANNVSFGTAGSTVTASVTVASTQASIVIGTLLSSRFSFINSNNVSWTINATGGINASASFPAQTQFVLSNSNGLTWGTAGSTVTGSFSTLSFGNANNVTFGLAGSTLTASVTVASTQASILMSAGTTSVLSSSFRFQNSNNVSFGMNAAGVVTATVQSSIGSVVAGTLSLAGGVNALSFQDSNGISWQLSTNAGTPGMGFVQASYAREIGLVSHVGGNSVANVTRLAFSNASNVTFSLSTAAGAATLLASVAAGGAGGVNFSAGTTNVVAATQLSFLDVVSTGGTNGVSWGINGSTITARVTPAIVRLAAGTLATFTGGSVLSFVDSNGVSFGLSSVGSVGVVTASHNGLTAQSLQSIDIDGGTQATGVTNFRINDQGNILLNATSAANAMTLGISMNDRDYLAAWVPHNEGQLSTVAQMDRFPNRPFFFPMEPMDLEATHGNVAASNLATIGVGRWLFALEGGTVTTGALGSARSITFHVGLYTLNNSTQLSLINSASVAVAATSSGASLNSLWGGKRWLEIPRTNWSNSTLSVRDQVWCAFMYSIGNTTNTASLGNLNMIGLSGAMDFGAGFVGSAQNSTALSAFTQIPFFGLWTTTVSHISQIGTAGSTNNNQFSFQTLSTQFRPMVVRVGNARIGQI